MTTLWKGSWTKSPKTGFPILREAAHSDMLSPYRALGKVNIFWMGLGLQSPTRAEGASGTVDFETHRQTLSNQPFEPSLVRGVFIVRNRRTVRSVNTRAFMGSYPTAAGRAFNLPGLPRAAFREEARSRAATPPGKNGGVRKSNAPRSRASR
jgi:hypothetical protein